MSHIGIIVEDLDQAVEEWCDRYGLQVVEGGTVEVEGVRNAFVSPGPGREEAACVELMEPLDKSDMSNPIARRLAKVGEGVYHAAFWVDDPATAGERLRDEGVTAIDAPPTEEDAQPRAIVHPKSANGLLLELI